MDLEGKGGEDILGVKNSMHTEAAWHETIRHAWGMANWTLCRVHQIDRMGSGIYKGWRSRPELGCDCFSTEF